ncbi:hypothetical protein G806_01319, partial [Escherichia coli HVH 148 (4-3192490)]
KQKKLIMLPSETMIWQPEFTDKTLSRKPGAVHSEANILSTFKQLHQNKDELFERGEINAFRGLSRDYKTRPPCKFSNKIIINNLVRWDRWG